MQSLFSAASGLSAQSLKQDVIGNNIANISTPGFKKKRAELAESFVSPVSRISEGGVGNGVKVTGVRTIDSQGAFWVTDRLGDVGIAGKGLIPVERGDGAKAFSRGGSLVQDAEGFVRTSEGSYVLGAGGRIQLPDTLSNGVVTSGFQIASNGVVEAVGADGSAETLDQLLLADFPNPEGLNSAGDNLYTSSAASGSPQFLNPDTLGSRIQSGVLEQSNVDIAEEMTNMILVQRAFEANVKTIQTTNEMFDVLNSLKRSS